MDLYVHLRLFSVLLSAGDSNLCENELYQLCIVCCVVLLFLCRPPVNEQCWMTQKGDSFRLYTKELEKVYITMMLLVSDIYYKMSPHLTPSTTLDFKDVFQGLSSKLGFHFSCEKFENITETRGDLQNSRN